MKEKNILMGILCYVGPFVLVSYLAAKDDPFVKFHIKQGLVLLVIEGVVWLASWTFWMLWPVYELVNLGTLILSIVGIINVAQGEEKELPLIGEYASNFKI